jgi:hypothetical protein
LAGAFGKLALAFLQGTVAIVFGRLAMTFGDSFLKPGENPGGIEEVPNNP